ncbi:MAG: hypothetical protein CO098_01145 [Bacteroidetes bacterium CG_4_9_14_3_um_filter_41_19]|nr:MAG: hypothetical protein CO098_01145 [Bacteroidetes bacterium CG_4_9_14_3_um_filter_41_19]
MLKTYEKIICFNHRIQAGSLPLRSNEDERGGREREESFQNDWQSCILVTATLKRGRERDHASLFSENTTFLFSENTTFLIADFDTLLFSGYNKLG